MAQRPIYVKGRGRSRGAIRNSDFIQPPPFGINQTGNVRPSGLQVRQQFPSSPVVDDHTNTKTNSKSVPMTADERFEEAVERHKNNTDRVLNNPSVTSESSDDEDINDEQIIDSLTGSFMKIAGKSSSGDAGLGRTREFLVGSITSRANVCLICIESIKHVDAIWNCQECFCSLHINCIQKWISDGAYQKSLNDDNNVNHSSLPWNCPKCRKEYSQKDKPKRYACYCGKEEDPAFDPWLFPHSCGQTCEKLLKPECGHACLMLCHPGPCPPCPQTVRSTCHCGRQPAQTRRCGTREWSCGKPCNQLLQCGIHFCNTRCHGGDCSPCGEASKRKCRCGQQNELKPCSEGQWQCDKVCGKKLSCNNHVCEAICHSGECGSCARSEKRTCPCGKTILEDLSCSEEAPTCLETCGKLLMCNRHECTQRCHNGPCGTCREMVEKYCRCGQKKKEIQCYKEFLCETKCTKLKDCGRHPCKRKCCNGDCPPCDLSCNRLLNCRKHKCTSQCHRGQCYPCSVTTTLSCACKSTSITLPCGRAKNAKPPKCTEICRNPPVCHHPQRELHRCHFGDCPDCKQICGKRLKCGHDCPVECHSAVRTEIRQQVIRVGPWEQVPEPQTVIENRSCPPCMVPVPVTCLGGHDTCDMPCHIAVSKSCGRRCGRKLKCSNHECQKECHAGTNCEQCEEGCSKTRPDGCHHKCLLPCHPKDCPDCTQMVRMRCHCQMVVQHVKCHIWTKSDAKECVKLQSCPGKCPRLLECGHQCTLTCHPGLCPSASNCTEKVKMKCSCKRRKKEYICNEVFSKRTTVDCDEACVLAKEKLRKENEKEEKQRKEEEEKKIKRELEEFERRQTKPKRKPRRHRESECRQPFLERYRKLFLTSIVVLACSIVVYYLYNA